jgi:hypothetical protein
VTPAASPRFGSSTRRTGNGDGGYWEETVAPNPASLRTSTPPPCLSRSCARPTARSRSSASRGRPASWAPRRTARRCRLRGQEDQLDVLLPGAPRRPRGREHRDVAREQPLQLLAEERARLSATTTPSTSPRTPRRCPRCATPCPSSARSCCSRTTRSSRSRAARRSPRATCARTRDGVRLRQLVSSGVLGARPLLRVRALHRARAPRATPACANTS